MDRCAYLNKIAPSIDDLVILILATDLVVTFFCIDCCANIARLASNDKAYFFIACKFYCDKVIGCRNI